MSDRSRCRENRYRENRVSTLAILVVVLSTISFASVQAYVLPPQPDPNVPGEGDGDGDYMKTLPPPIKLEPGTGSNPGTINPGNGWRPAPAPSPTVPVVGDQPVQPRSTARGDFWTAFRAWWMVFFRGTF